MQVLRDYLKELLPGLQQSLAQCPDSFEMVVQQWFCSLFVGWLPTHTLLRAWDLLIANGRGGLMRLALALLCYLEPAMVSALGEEPEGLFNLLTVAKQEANACVDAEALVS